MKASVYLLSLFLGECTPVSFSKGTLSQALGHCSDPEGSDMCSGWFMTSLIHHLEADLQRSNCEIERKREDLIGSTSKSSPCDEF